MYSFISLIPYFLSGVPCLLRYFPLVFCVTGHLTITGVMEAYGRYSATSERPPFAAAADGTRTGIWFLVKNVGLLLLTLPNHIAFLRVRALFRILSSC